MSFQTIVDFVGKCRGTNGRKEKAGYAKEVGKQLAKLGEKEIVSFLATLFPVHHPNKYMPIGLTTLAYTLREILQMKGQGRLTCVSKGENPFDWIGSADKLCKQKKAEFMTVGAIQNGIKMLYKVTGKSKCENLECVLEECTPEQGRLFCEILGCNLNFGMRIKMFLEAVEADAAVASWIMSNSLERVAHAIATGEVAPLTVGYYVSSMLARQKPFDSPEDAFAFINGETKKRARTLIKASGSYIAQLKVDGYRIQLHREKKSGRFWYYSRHNLDMADTYFFNALNDVIGNNIEADSYILDGEVIAFNRSSKEFVPCSEMSASLWTKSSEIRLVFFAFDLLFYDGVQCMDMPYRKRLKKLQKLLPTAAELDGHMVVPMLDGAKWNGVKLGVKVSDKEEVKRYFDKVVGKDLEGIMLKDLESKWEPFARSNNHLKIKPPPQAFDLFIVGANINRLQMVSSLLLAYKKDEEYYTLCSCGTGLTYAARQALTLVIAESATWSTKGGHYVPAWLHAYGAEHPHMYLETPLACKVTAQKMINSVVYAGGKSLRFPVIREIPDIRYSEKKVFVSEDEIPVEVGFVQKESDLLEGMLIWLFKGDADVGIMSEMSRNVLRMGGRYLMDPDGDETIDLIVICGSESTTALDGVPRVNANWLRKSYMWNSIMPYDQFEV